MSKPSKPPPTLPRRPLYAKAWDVHRVPQAEVTRDDILTAVRAAAEGSVRRNKGPRPRLREQVVSVGLRLSEALVMAIDDFAAKENIGRSEAIRRILEERLG